MRRLQKISAGLFLAPLIFSSVSSLAQSPALEEQQLPSLESSLQDYSQALAGLEKVIREHGEKQPSHHSWNELFISPCFAAEGSAHCINNGMVMVLPACDLRNWTGAVNASDQEAMQELGIKNECRAPQVFCGPIFGFRESDTGVKFAFCSADSTQNCFTEAQRNHGWAHLANEFTKCESASDHSAQSHCSKLKETLLKSVVEVKNYCGSAEARMVPIACNYANRAGQSLSQVLSAVVSPQTASAALAAPPITPPQRSNCPTCNDQTTPLDPTGQAKMIHKVSSDVENTIAGPWSKFPEIMAYGESEQVKNTLNYATAHSTGDYDGYCWTNTRDAVVLNPYPTLLGPVQQKLTTSAGKAPLARMPLATPYASQAVPALKYKGFVNLLEDPKYKGMIKSAADAPKGAVLVYGGGYADGNGFMMGHTEIKTGWGSGGGYYSGPFKLKPVNDPSYGYNGTRFKLIGVMVIPGKTD